MKSIDFNCDLGEGCGQDEQLLPLISSASIACGFHAGSPIEMERAVDQCVHYGVAIGAHPSFPDRTNFGRSPHQLPAEEVSAMVLYQVAALGAFARRAGTRLHHVKPHGALYNQAASEPAMALAIATAVKSFDPGLVLYGLAGSELIRAGRKVGLAVAQEAFAERRYEADGTLTPRSHPDSVWHSVDHAKAQVRELLDGQVIARTGERVGIVADTLCLHGDRLDAVEFALELRETIETAGFAIRASLKF